jgi:hypothetical protein
VLIIPTKVLRFNGSTGRKEQGLQKRSLRNRARNKAHYIDRHNSPYQDAIKLWKEHRTHPFSYLIPLSLPQPPNRRNNSTAPGNFTHWIIPGMLLLTWNLIVTDTFQFYLLCGVVIWRKVKRREAHPFMPKPGEGTLAHTRSTLSSLWFTHFY